MTRSLLIALLLASSPALLAGCATQRSISGEVSRERLFPFGTYRHNVALTLPADQAQPERRFDFTGIVQLRPDSVRVTVLSFFGTTAFRITDHLASGEIQTEIFVEPLRKLEPRLREYYGVLRELLLAEARAPRSDGRRLKWVRTNERGRPVELQSVGLEREATFRMAEFDQNDIPGEFVIEHPRFNVLVKVAGYEL